MIRLTTTKSSAFSPPKRPTGQRSIYSLRNDSWKRIEDFKTGTPVHSSGKLVKGKLHWLAYDHRKYTRPRDFIALAPCPKILVALDLAKEEYEIVVGPQHFSYYDYWLRSVSNLGGNLGLVCVNGMRSDSHVWAMMKYGEAESWSKIWARSEYLSPERERIVSLLWFRENGDIAVRSGPSRTCIEVYNIKDKSRKSRVYKVDGNLGLLCLYVESLVSPFGDQDLGDEFELEQLQFVL